MSVPVSVLLNRLQFETDHAPDSSPEWRRRAIYHLDKAQKRLIRDAPFMSREVEFRAILRPDVSSASDTDLFETTGDPWVLKRVLSEGHEDAAVWDVPLPESYGGRTLRVSSAGDQPDEGYDRTREFTIREVWTANDINAPESPYYLYVSLSHPWQGDAAQDLRYRAFTKDLHLPAGVGQIRHIKVHDHPTSELKAYTAGTWDEENYARYSLDNAVQGQPQIFTRGQTSFLPAPHTPPTLVVEPQETGWVGPEPVGSFMYALRLVFGKQELWQHTGNPSTQLIVSPASSRVKPWLSSALGPSSVRASNSGGAGSITLTFPNFDFAEGFDGVATLREHRSGYRVQVWRKRLTSDTALDFDSRFYLLDEVPGDVGTYVDTGDVTPDRNTPAPGYGGVQPSLKFYPAGDQRYELIIRAVQELAELVTDTQVPNVDVLGVDLLVHLAKGYIYEAMGNASYANTAFKDYHFALEAVKRRTASAIPRNRLVTLRPGGSSGTPRRLRYRNDRPSKTET